MQWPGAIAGGRDRNRYRKGAGPMYREQVSFGTFFLLTIVTFGIYPWYYYVRATEYKLHLLEKLVKERESQ